MTAALVTPAPQQFAGPHNLAISLMITPVTWPADTDALRTELRRVIAFVADIEPWGLGWLLVGRRKIALECNVGKPIDVLRLRGALARVVRVHAGAGSAVVFGGALAI